MSAPSQNKLTGRAARYKRQKLKDQFKDLAKLQSEAIPKAKTKRRVTFLRVYRKGKRKYDNDNLVAGFKGPRDVLKELGLIVDDNPRFIEAHYEQMPGIKDGIYITIEDVDWVGRESKTITG